jgi:hypothetical protein
MAPPTPALAALLMATGMLMLGEPQTSAVAADGASRFATPSTTFLGKTVGKIWKKGFVN